MPLFRREKKQEEENLEWLYRNLQEFDETVAASASREAEKKPPVIDEAEARKPLVTDPRDSEPSVTDLPPLESPTPTVGSSLLAQNEVISNMNETHERRHSEMSETRRESASYPNRAQQTPAPRPKRKEQPETDTVVGQQTYFTGTFRSERDLRIEGTFEGEIDCRGTVTVAEDAKLSATVRARNIEIAGSASGDIFIEERLHLRTSGEMRGQFQAASFIVEEGAYFEGEMKMGSAGLSDWPLVGSGSSSEEIGNPVESAQWATNISGGRSNRPNASHTDSIREDSGSNRHRSV